MRKIPLLLVLQCDRGTFPLVSGYWDVFGFFLDLVNTVSVLGAPVSSCRILVTPLLFLYKDTATVSLWCLLIVALACLKR